ncbi:uncharacterized protein LOC135397607 isoform X5 [Ornithodoros turicata]|uniref:uncharacterized protein LOC135397607 isoform X5 n=1 Tax=Ornithodoros turicata TaxID=34597 RepID=UPI003138900E
MPSVTHSNPIRAVHAHEDINSKSTHSKARRKFAAAGLSDSAFLWVTILHASPSGTAHHPVHHPVTAMQQKLPRIYMTHVLVPIALAIVSLVLEISKDKNDSDAPWNCSAGVISTRHQSEESLGCT